MRRGRYSLNRLLKKMMLCGGLILGMAMMRAYVSEQERGQSVQAWMEEGKRWLAGEMVQWTWEMISGQNTWNQTGERKQAGWEHAEVDPGYPEYLARQEMMKESAYLLLFGDENSNLAAEGGWGTTVGEKTSQQDSGESNPAASVLAGNTPAYHIRQHPPTGTTYLLEQLMDYDFLMKHFYNVHSSTTAGREEMNAGELLGMNLALTAEERQQGNPQILIYHTHSQETYADYSAEKPDATVVGVGNYLAKLLEQKGYQVLHDISVYDLAGGQLDRNHAYNYALDGITGILQKYPSIQVVLDVHRDGVKEGLHLVSEVNGKPTAPIMFFNGMSQTPEGPIEYLQNPYKKENLAFSLQMQLDAVAYYPGLTRKIYLKGLRYNLHLRPRSALIEVGAQTNTYSEALNAMEPLAEILDMVLSGNPA